MARKKKPVPEKPAGEEGDDWNACLADCTWDAPVTIGQEYTMSAYEKFFVVMPEEGAAAAGAVPSLGNQLKQIFTWDMITAQDGATAKVKGSTSYRQAVPRYGRSQGFSTKLTGKALASGCTPALMAMQGLALAATALGVAYA